VNNFIVFISTGNALFAEEDGCPKISKHEKAQLRSEFLNTMQQRFMMGQDEHFDYK
jgi:hypothetical protein